MPRFSVCIPNFNYASYLGATLRSVLDQHFDDFEVLIADNASTDDSVELVRQIEDSRISIEVNRCNVGFAGNLDRVASRAQGDLMIVLSSDDLVAPDALACYDHLFSAVGDRQVVVSAVSHVIDAAGNVQSRLPIDRSLWSGAHLDADLTQQVGHPVLALPAAEMLRRCLRTMANPFSFLSTAYQRTAYDAIEGYWGGRQMNPDKWFHWRLLSVCETAYFVDAPLFSYRVHGANQSALQASRGSLQFLVDEYVSTLELDDLLLERAGVSHAEVVEAYIHHDIVRHGLGTLARGDRARARRILRFGAATYPAALRRNRYSWLLRALVAGGPVGQRLAALGHGRLRGLARSLD